MPRSPNSCRVLGITAIVPSRRWSSVMITSTLGRTLGRSMAHDRADAAPTGPGAAPPREPEKRPRTVIRRATQAAISFRPCRDNGSATRFVGRCRRRLAASAIFTRPSPSAATKARSRIASAWWQRRTLSLNARSRSSSTWSAETMVSDPHRFA